MNIVNTRHTHTHTGSDFSSVVGQVVVLLGSTTRKYWWREVEWCKNWELLVIREEIDIVNSKVLQYIYISMYTSETVTEKSEYY